MPQHDLDIANASGAAFRADVNGALGALGSCMRGPNPPTAPVAGMWWVDDNTPSTTRWTLSMYDGAAWITAGILDISADRFEPANALPSLGGTLSGDLSIAKANPLLALNTAAAGQINRVAGYTAGSIRWSLDLGDGAAESSTATGSNLRLARFSNSGAYLGDVLTVDRATGQVALEGGRAWNNTNLPPLGTAPPRATFAGAAGLAWNFARGDHQHQSELPDGIWVDQMAYAGVADVPNGSWLNLADLVIPDRAVRLIMAGTFMGQQTTNASNTMRFNLQLLNSGLTEISNIYAGGVSTFGTAHPFVQGGLRGMFNPPDQNGMRLRLRVQKDVSNGPFNIIEAYAAVMVVRRLS